ncbi:MAG: hypothetical protein PHE55_18045 [Methylococcaceae bacterium]|nr:hypothetical protein [Methylococcaceae bacterium]
MSTQRDNFDTNANQGNWEQAFFYLNGLNMFEMLRALAALHAETRKKLWDARIAYQGRFYMARIEYAMTVVNTGRLPASAPGDLEATGQVQDARNFLAQPSGWDALHKYKHPGKLTVRITIYLANNASMDPTLRYVQVARELLAVHGLALDAQRVSARLVYSEQLYLLSQADDLRKLAELAQPVPANRLAIIVCPMRDNMGDNDNGISLSDRPGWPPFVLINSNLQSTDGVTLLHEIGHAAGNGHVATSGSDVVFNFMSYGHNRSDMLRNQVIKIAKSFFCG